MDMENDPIVKEIPVFLSKTLAEKLFVIQYPIYVKNGYNKTVFSKTSIKPKNQKICIEITMDTLNEHSYDHNIGKQLAFNTNKKSTEEDNENTFDNGLMDKLVLTSERVLPDCSNFAVGVFEDDELHITPLKGMLRMKLQCDYLDENDKHVRDEKTDIREDDTEEENSATPMQVKFVKHLSDNRKKKQEQSFHYHYKQIKEERWIHTNYILPDDILAELTRMEMFCPSIEESMNPSLSRKHYLHILVPQLPKACNLLPRIK
ncbi:hypothetical protein P5V15_000501 [Pogonomyrmex californicus]